jgi:ribose/xylose/arabinose/galactoside ABC-type transport system permease subunit
MAVSEEHSQSLDLAAEYRGPSSGISNFVSKNRRALGALLVFVVLMLIFLIANPSVFTNPLIYRAIARTLPMTIILAVALVFVVASGEIDLSFGSIVGLSAWAFALALQAGYGPYVGVLFALIVGAFTGLINGIIVTRLGLASLVSTLGMGFLIRGLINVGTQGEGYPVTFLRDTTFYNVFIGNIGDVPVHMLWAIGFVVLGSVLFSRHIFGARISCVGDNLESSREMGINIAVIKTLAFVFVGIASAIVAIQFTLTNQIFYPTSGEGLLMIVLAAVFVGGTPGWGGVGTIVGAALGACTVGVIESGIVAAGASHLLKEFFYGLIIILALISHKLSEPRYRY